MSQLINASQISLDLGNRTLFEDLSLVIETETHLGVIGRNGSGKSSLLKVLMGTLTPDGGLLSRAKDVRIVTVAQESSWDSECTIQEILDQATPVHSEPGHVQRLLGAIGIEEPERKVKQLSGGWRKRLAIAEALAQDPNLLLLDEPTNHLDYQGIAWLERLLARSRIPWVCVSHDRTFLSRATRQIAELSCAFPGCLFIADGPYEQFRQRKFEFLEAQRKKVESLKNKLTREEKWLRTQPKARTTKARYRIDQAEELKQEYEELKQSLVQKTAAIELTASGRKTKELIRAKKITKGFSEHKRPAIVESLSLTVTSRMRLGILGENGSGKSTLLRLLTGQLAADAGELWHAPDLKLHHFDQHRERLNEQDSVREALGSDNDQVVFRGQALHVSSWARRFGFNPEDLDRKISTLSGGEKARVVLASFMLLPADVLVLDEPTNDLDIATIESLEDSLASFEGAILVVSHDRSFLSNLCQRFIALDGRGHHVEVASFEQWERTLLAEAKQTAKKGVPDRETQKSTTRKRSSSSTRLSYMEQREYDGMEESILKAEQELEQLSAESMDPEASSDPQKMQELGARIQQTQQALDGLYQRWAELEAKLS